MTSQKKSPGSKLFEFNKANDFHAALAQLHRWWQVYESDQPEAHFDIFANDFVVDSATGQLQGLEAFKKRLSDFKGWKNAHHLVKAEVTKSTDQEIALDAEIIYQNIRPNGDKFAFRLKYETLLKKLPGQLPVFKLIKLRPIANLSDTTFVDAYAENRLKSFTHYWLYLMETANGDPAAFKELLGAKYSLDLGQPSPTTNWETFSKWVKSVPTWLARSSHTILNENDGIQPFDSSTIKASWDFDWQGQSTKGEDMIAKTHHDWILNINQGQRFATMKEMSVKVLVPFQNVPKP